MKNIEKQLIKRAQELPLMKKEIEISRDDYTTKTSKKTFLFISKICVFSVLACCCMTLIVSAQVREPVFTFLKSVVQEVIPSFHNIESQNSKNSSILVEHKEIKDIADIYYYDLTNCKVDNNLIVNSDIEGEYYYLHRGAMSNIESVKRIEGTFIVNQNKISVKFDVIDLDNKKFVYNYNSGKADKNTDISALAIKVYDDKHVWIETVDRTQLRTQKDLLLYNIETGEIKDVFGKFLPENFEVENVMINESGKYVLVQEFNGGSDQGLYYLFNIENKEMITLENLTGITTVDTCGFVDDELIYITASSTDAINDKMLNGYIYNITSGEVKQLYGTQDKVIFSNGKITIKQKMEYYEISYYTGEKFKLQNVNLDGLTFFSNSLGTKVVAINLNESERGMLNINELGVIDINARTFKIFERKGIAEGKEYSVGWDLMDNVIITTDCMLYQYVFK